MRRKENYVFNEEILFFFSKELKKTRVKALKYERKKHEILRKETVVRPLCGALSMK